MANWFVISYDASDYKKANPKEDLTEYLLQKLSIRALQSFTDSTIHFYAPYNKEDVSEILYILNEAIKREFPDFKFSLSAIAKNDDDMNIFVNTPKQPLKDEYDALVKRLKEKLNIKE